MTNWIPFFQWFVDLNGEAKAVIAILLAIGIYFGMMQHNTKQELDALQTLYNTDNKECSKEVAKVTEFYRVQLDSSNVKWQNKYNGYRDKVENENKILTKEWERKYENLSERFDRYQHNNINKNK